MRSIILTATIFFISNLPIQQVYSKAVRGSPYENTVIRDSDTISFRRRLATSPVDVLFIIDESNSMFQEQKDVRERVKEIFDRLPPNSAVGLVGYGGRRSSPYYSPTLHPSEPHVHTTLTTNSSQFQDAADDLVAEGVFEPAYLSLYRSVSNGFEQPLGFRGNRYCSILITDEFSNHDDGITREQTIDALNGGTNSTLQSAFFGITTDKVRQSYETIAAATGGAMFRLEDFRNDPSFVLGPVLDACTLAVLKNILLDPANDQKGLGESHTVSASVLEITEDNGVIDAQLIGAGFLQPQPGVLVNFTVANGPNEGASGVCTAGEDCITDEAGRVSFTYAGNGGAGVDEIQACFVDATLGEQKCTTVQAEWLAPTTSPTSSPTVTPTTTPSNHPSQSPSNMPSTLPSMIPSNSPSVMPSSSPSLPPSLHPSSKPSMIPTTMPSQAPSVMPSSMPTAIPSTYPSSVPSSQPSHMPSESPSTSPSSMPSSAPSSVPSSFPSVAPSGKPSGAPSTMPSPNPTLTPTAAPTTLEPTSNPSAKPTEAPTEGPTRISCPEEKNLVFVLDVVEFPGETRNCKWLQKPVGDRLEKYCNRPKSTAKTDCPLTCGKCDPLQDPACEEEERNALFLRDVDGPQERDVDIDDPRNVNVRRCKWLVKGEDRVEEFCPRSTSNAAAVCPCNCSQQR